MYKFGNQNTLSLNDNSNSNKRLHFTPSYTSASNSFNPTVNNGFNAPSNSIFGALTSTNNKFGTFAPTSSTPAPTNNKFGTFGATSSTPTNNNFAFATTSSTPTNNNFAFATTSSTPTNNNFAFGSTSSTSSTPTNNNFAFGSTSSTSSTPTNNNFAFGSTSSAPANNNFGTNTFTLGSANQNSVIVNSNKTSDNTIGYKRVFSFNDVNILPSLTTLKSKNEVSLLTKITKDILTKIPIIILTDNLSNLIEISTNGGLGLFRSYDFVEQLNYVKCIKKYINPIDQTPITIHSNTTFDELKKIFNDDMIDYIAVVDQENTCLGFIEKKNIGTLNGNFYANEIMTPLDSMKFYKKTDCNWSDLLTGPPNQELIDSLNTTNIIPIICDNKKLQGVMTLNNIIKYYNTRSKCVLDNTGRLLSCISTGIFDNYTERVDNYTECVGNYMERVDILIKAGLDILHLNIDNAYNELVFNIVKEIKQKYENLIIMVGNVNSVDAFKYICESGADSICVGNGTDLGQFTLLQECFQLSKKYNVSIINNSGFFNENLNLIKSFSAGSKCILFKDNYKDRTLYIPDILESIQSGLLYVNCTSIENLHLSDINYTIN